MGHGVSASWAELLLLKVRKKTGMAKSRKTRFISISFDCCMLGRNIWFRTILDYAFLDEETG